MLDLDARQIWTDSVSVVKPLAQQPDHAGKDSATADPLDAGQLP